MVIRGLSRGLNSYGRQGANYLYYNGLEVTFISDDDMGRRISAKYSVIYTLTVCSFCTLNHGDFYRI